MKKFEHFVSCDAEAALELAHHILDMLIHYHAISCDKRTREGICG